MFGPGDGKISLARPVISRDDFAMIKRYRPFHAGSDRLSMGLKALDPADWLEIGEDFDHQMTERRHLLEQQPLDVVAGLPGSEAGQDELLAILLQHLTSHAADRYRVGVGGGSIEDLKSGETFSLMSEAEGPLMLIGRLVQEDFCLLQQRSEAYHLVAAVLCFPAHWHLHEKLGRPMLDIHAPVPGFADQLGSPVHRLFERLDVERPVQRLNWSLVDTTDLYLPPSHRGQRVAVTEHDAGEKLWLRVERQTLRRLPVSKDIVFGIRTHLTRLDEAIDSKASAEALIARLSGMPEAMVAYKNLKHVKKPLIGYLRRVGH